jgi:hypothetical protein
MPASDSPSPRLRFTLRALLIAIAGIALVVTWINTYRMAQRNRFLETENRRLRNEVGALSVEDETRFYAIKLPTDNALEWAWRIWIPEGRRYQVHTASGPVPKEGFPQMRATVTIGQPGEHVVRYRIERDPRDNHWQGTMKAGGASVGKFEQPWVEWGNRTSMTGGVGTSTVDFPPDERVELIRHRVSQATSTDKIEDPSAGFMIWLEPN